MDGFIPSHGWVVLAQRLREGKSQNVMDSLEFLKKTTCSYTRSVAIPTFTVAVIFKKGNTDIMLIYHRL